MKSNAVCKDKMQKGLQLILQLRKALNILKYFEKKANIDFKIIITLLFSLVES